MKLWLHFRELLKPYRKRVRNRRSGEDFFNEQEIVDVEVAMPDSPKAIMIRNMEQLLVKKNDLQQKLANKAFKGTELFNKLELQDQMVDLHRQMKDRYKMLIDDDMDADANPLIKQAHECMTQVDYVFVTFKHVDTIEQCLNVFRKELTLVKCFRFCLCMKS